MTTRDEKMSTTAGTADATPEIPVISRKQPELGFRDKLAEWYLVYELRTALYSLEPWEKALFNSCLVAILSMSCYTAYRFLPGYTASLLTYFNVL